MASSSSCFFISKNEILIIERPKNSASQILILYSDTQIVGFSLYTESCLKHREV